MERSGMEAAPILVARKSVRTSTFSGSVLWEEVRTSRQKFDTLERIVLRIILHLLLLIAGIKLIMGEVSSLHLMTLIFTFWLFACHWDQVWRGTRREIYSAGFQPVGSQVASPPGSIPYGTGSVTATPHGPCSRRDPQECLSSAVSRPLDSTPIARLRKQQCATA